MAKREPPFSQDEYLDRQRRARAELQALGLDALLLFKIEDMYWLCGYESDGFCIFGCMLLGAEEGGSGVPLERAKYMESCAFWREHASLK